MSVPEPTVRQALPAWVYSHPRMTQLEIERILRPSWQVACHVNSIPRAGDYTAFDLGPDSVVVLRDKEGQIRAFHNVCRHRGARLLDGDGHCSGLIVCPYHGWSYQTDGRLTGVPLRDSFPGLDRDAHGLKPVHVEIMLGLVFVCLADVPPAPPSQVWAGLLDELSPYRMEEMQPLGPIGEEHWEVDWKIAMDNYLESYHVPIGHPGLNRLATPDNEDQSGVPGVARGISWLRDTPSPRWSERAYQALLAKTPIDLPPAQLKSWRFYSGLPNLGIDLYPEQVDFFQILPRGPGRCTIRYALFGHPDSRREMKALRWLGSRINASVNAEDRWLCERVQRGLQSPSYTPGPLSTIEKWMLEFHEQLERTIPEVRLPTAPDHFAAYERE
jgi:phenylpropionate dioxygenase-like ring-hydroxylating dioxygenase large terminal subunit